MIHQDFRTGALAGPVKSQLPESGPPYLALIGEAPGQKEIIAGYPFAGPAGRKLDEILADLGIERKRCFIGNIFTFQPNWSADINGKRKNNDITSFFTNQNEDADMELSLYRGMRLRKEYREDVSRIINQLKTYPPLAIVTLGSTALWGLTGHDGISQYRGNSVKSAHFDAPIFPTYHPAYALHRRDADASRQILETIKSDIKQAIASLPNQNP